METTGYTERYEEALKKFNQLEAEFNNNPNKKTATALSAARRELTYMDAHVRYKYTDEKLEEIKALNLEAKQIFIDRINDAITTLNLDK